MNIEKFYQDIRLEISRLYQQKKTDELILKTSSLIKASLEIGMNTGDITKRLIDLGLRYEELGISVCMAIEQIPFEKLTDPRDYYVKMEAHRINSEVVKYAEQVKQ